MAYWMFFLFKVTSSMERDQSHSCLWNMVGVLQEFCTATLPDGHMTVMHHSCWLCAKDMAAFGALDDPQEPVVVLCIDSLVL
jgi:hypothetical protein